MNDTKIYIWFNLKISMNSKLFVFSALFLALTLGLVLAQSQEPPMAEPEYAPESSDQTFSKPFSAEQSDQTFVKPLPTQSDQTNEEPKEPVEDMAIFLTTPANGKVYTFPITSDVNAMAINFGFTVEPLTPSTVEADCKVIVSGTSEFVLDAQLVDMGAGSALTQLVPGSYSWSVECMKDGVLFTSEDAYSFQIVGTVEPQIPNNNNPTNTNNNNNGGPNNRDNDDDSGRRLNPISLPLQELSNTAESSEDQESSPGITGAVIGALKGKTLVGIIILAVVLGVAGLVIYNRRKLGVVKAK